MLQQLCSYVLRFVFLNLCLLVSHSAVAAESFIRDEDLIQYPALKEAYESQKAGSFKQALKVYKFAYHKNLGRVSAIKGIVFCHEKLNQYAEAVEFLKEDIERKPFEVESRLLLAQMFIDKQKWADALTQLDVAERLSAAETRTLNMKGFVFHRQENWEESIKYFSKYLEKEKDDSIALMHRAQCFHKLGKFDKAYHDIRTAYGLKPFNSELLLTYFHVLYDQGKFKDAEPYAKQCSEVAPENVDCWERWGDVAVKLNRNGDAIRHFGRAARLAPNHFQIRRKFADALNATGKFAEADPQYIQAMQLKPDSEETMRVWAQSLKPRQAYNVLGDQLNQFRQNNPKNIWAAIEYAQLMTMVGRNEEAMEAMRAATKASRSELSYMYYGHALFAAGKYSKAEDQIEDIKDASLAKDFNMAVNYIKWGKTEKAIKHWSMVKADSPAYYRAQINMALALSETGKVGESIQILSDTKFPNNMQETVSKHLAYLNSVKNREPSSEKNAPAKAVSEIPYSLDWELPKL